MSKLVLMAIIAASVLAASCGAQQKSLFADEPTVEKKDEPPPV